MKTTKTRLAMGDSMSIDFCTGQAGGGAVAQFLRRVRQRADADTTWELDDRTCDRCKIADVNCLRRSGPPPRPKSHKGMPTKPSHEKQKGF